MRWYASFAMAANLIATTCNWSNMAEIEATSGIIPARTPSAARATRATCSHCIRRVRPAALVADAILDCTAPRDIVLDGFLGSGTTVIAAEKTGRRCYGTELDPAYVDIIVRRWQKLTGKTARHAETGQAFDDLTATPMTEVANAA